MENKREVKLTKDDIKGLSLVTGTGRIILNRLVISADDEPVGACPSMVAVGICPNCDNVHVDIAPLGSNFGFFLSLDQATAKWLANALLNPPTLDAINNEDHGGKKAEFKKMIDLQPGDKFPDFLGHDA